MKYKDTKDGTAQPGPNRRGVKRRRVFCVKKGRLFERSEFLPFSKRRPGVAPEVQPLTFSFGIFSFASRQKKSATILNMKYQRLNIKDTEEVTAQPGPNRRGVKRRRVFCVKKGRLFEQSEFLPFSKRRSGVAPEVQPLTFSFGIFSFASRQKKSTKSMNNE